MHAVRQNWQHHQAEADHSRPWHETQELYANSDVGDHVQKEYECLERHQGGAPSSTHPGLCKLHQKQTVSLYK